MNSVHLRCIAKVNIGLHIMGRLSNGYHILETLFYPVHELFDEMVVEKAPGNSCAVSMPGFREEVPLEKNLAWKAWKLLAERYPLEIGGIKVIIRKRIPSGAGLGGGSSNAAGVMMATNQLFGLGLSNEHLAALAEPLGADVPFFIFGEPLYATGIGNRFKVLDLNLKDYILEVRPQSWYSSTLDAYAGLDLTRINHKNSLRDLLLQPVARWKGSVVNDLETSVFHRIPGIRCEIEKLYQEGAVYAAMTGSGSAVFGLFSSDI